MIVAQPIGHSVPFSKVVHTSRLWFVFGELTLPTGNQMTKIRMMARLDMVPTLLSWPMNLVDCIVSTPFKTRSATSTR